MENSTFTIQQAPDALVASKPVITQNRIASVDVYRGFVMLLMMGEVLSFSKVSASLPGNGFWESK